MSNITVEKMLAVLKRVGVHMSLRGAAGASVAETAQDLGVDLNEEDKETLESVVNSLRPFSSSTATPGEIGFQMNVFHIPEFNTPAGKRRPGKTGEVAAHSGHVVVDKGKLPPWGYMDESLIADIDPPIPLDWELANGKDPTNQQWEAWVDSLVTNISSLIWPQTSATIGILLDADFELLEALHPSMGLPIKSALPTTVQHCDFFAQEDDPQIAFGRGYDAYDDTLPKHVMDNFTTVLTAGIADKVGSLDLQLKSRFQRPRAYQVALIQGRDGFRYRSAATANTPSMVSGHCLQGSLAGCTAFATWGGSMTPKSVEELQQFTVDIGDRRVFAGVHYPSDNLSSWYTALKLIPHVFVRPADAWVTAFLWKAIDSRSIVFDAIKRHIDANPGHSPYEKGVDAIRAIAQGQTGTPMRSSSRL